MTIEARTLSIGGLRVAVVRKAIKNLHLGVYPPDGRVRVAAPLALSESAIRVAVVRRLGWIRRRQAAFENQEREAPREMVSGESHYFLGHRYRLEVVSNVRTRRVVVCNRRHIELHARASDDAARRQESLHRWYRIQLRGLIPPILAKWEAALGVAVDGWGIKKMKTKWGSCIPETRRVWFNLELAKKPVQCLEYIVAHELMHLVEPHHNDRFVRLLKMHMPRWRQWRDELKSAPLAHANWIG